jgi:pyridoxine 5-phosphate synthase
MRTIALHVNVDHVATLRQARGTRYPDPVEAALMAERAGADGITVHLREDRRHIQDRDVHVMREVVRGTYNLEMAATEAMLALALAVKPDHVTLVPERREERTTEGGLDVVGQFESLKPLVGRLLDAGIRVSMFIEANAAQLDASKAVGAPVIELHTGAYCDAEGAERDREFARIKAAAAHADSIGLECHAGHGLSYDTVKPVAAIASIMELNIGHFLVGEAIFVGLDASIRHMRRLMDEARGV